MRNYKINEKGVIEISGCNTLMLAEEYGTPLYVMDEVKIREKIKLFKESACLGSGDMEIAYASKAFLNKAMCRIIKEEGIGLDVVSGGELYTALAAGVNPEKIIFHGNNKTEEELRMAIDKEVGRIVVDNFHELQRLDELAFEKGRTVKILLRVNPGIDAHTHEYIQTSKHDSKFGISILNTELREKIKTMIRNNNINFRGFHCHIGSQIFEEEFYWKAVKVMMRFIKDIKDECNYITKELNLGGGFGVYYAAGDKPMDIESCIKKLKAIVVEESEELELDKPKLFLEPGRAIVANAGYTLYTVGGTKQTYAGRKYVFVDGGMTDNPRTALYNAKYEAVIANKADKAENERYTIAGKCCESGDVLVKDVMLQTCSKGDILMIMSTGAYNYSMSSNYNKIPRPAVVFVKEGVSALKVKRETYEDLLRNDID